MLFSLTSWAERDSSNEPLPTGLRTANVTVFGLAPMEGVSDWAFRLWMAQAGSPSFMNTPFLRATETFPRSIPPDFAPELKRPELYKYQLIPQVMASRPEDLNRAARLFFAEGAGLPRARERRAGGSDPGVTRGPLGCGEIPNPCGQPDPQPRRHRSRGGAATRAGRGQRPGTASCCRRSIAVASRGPFERGR